MQGSTTDTKALDTYYSQLANFGTLNVTHEQGVRGAFRELLSTSAKPVGWTLVEEYALPGSRKRPDGTLLDVFQIPRGYWEAKDTKDDLEAEIKKKIALKYDLSNTIFEDTRRAVLYQNKQRVLDVDLTKRDDLQKLLARFLSHSPAEVEEYHKAADVFASQIPTLAKALLSIVDKERVTNEPFKLAFGEFQEMCRQSLNPDIHAAQIEEMLVQHLLTERLFRNVFGQSEFAGRNVIAAEIEKVIAALTSQSFSREAFLKSLDYFYVTIERAASTITDFSEKQGFLNNVYERFFQNFSPDTADTHGIVYTPQPIVDWMCASVEEVLTTQFGKGLSDKGVTILDPCTGTGNFLVNILRRISPMQRKHKYESELFANEVMLLPYYVASLNMERAYYDLQGQYAAFPGLCFADTLDLAKGQQMSFAFTEKNTERVRREQDAAITVIIGNPPYNVGQANENDNNKNRKYPDLDGRIKETYVRDSQATLHTKTYDAYVRFFRWATDRLNGQDGIVCFVTNNSFVDQFAFDGMRRHLLQDFTQVYHLGLHGNVRKNPKLSGTTHNVFGIQVGAGITIAVRRTGTEPFLKYHRVPENWRKTEKLAYLATAKDLNGVEWQTLEPDARHSWRNEGMEADFDTFLPIGTKEARASKSIDVQAIFKTYSPGVMTGRDSVVYNFNRDTLAVRVKQFIDDYNAEVHRWVRAGKPKDLDAFLDYSKVKWSRNLKAELQRERYMEFDTSMLRNAMYRPFTKQSLYFGNLIVDEHGSSGTFFPTPAQEQENLVMVLKVGAELPLFSLMANNIPDRLPQTGSQCFPLYTYAVDGKIRRDNITDWALAQFQAHFGPAVTKEGIFYYVYALLHAPAYRARYAENLKRDLPRVPLVGGGDGPHPGFATLLPSALATRRAEQEKGQSQNAVQGDKPFPRSDGGEVPKAERGPSEASSPFFTLADAGRKLAALHVHYETADEYPLTQVVNKDVPFSWRVTKMKLSKDRTAIVVNDALTLAGIPPEAFEYKLGNRSALEWVIDQYQTGTDKRSGLTSDPNREGDPEYIARLVGKVVTVSVETVRIVNSLPRVTTKE